MYAVGSNVPGYAPEADATIVETVEEAQAVLSDELERHLDFLADIYGVESKVFDDAYRTVAGAQRKPVQEVTLPASDSAHDLGRVFWID